MDRKIILYGSAQCVDCVELKALLDEKQVHYGYVEVLGGLGHLKKFLNIRDTHPELYENVRSHGRIGIPTLVVDDADVYVLPDEETLGRILTE